MRARATLPALLLSLLVVGLLFASSSCDEGFDPEEEEERLAEQTEVEVSATQENHSAAVGASLPSEMSTMEG